MKANKGDYVVLLKSCEGGDCWRGSIDVDYIYKLRKDAHSHSFYMEKDSRGSKSNGWDANKEYDSKLSFRMATDEEIQMYNAGNKPCKALKIIETYQIY